MFGEVLLEVDSVEVSYLPPTLPISLLETCAGEGFKCISHDRASYAFAPLDSLCVARGSGRTDALESTLLEPEEQEIKDVHTTTPIGALQYMDVLEIEEGRGVCL